MDVHRVTSYFVSRGSAESRMSSYSHPFFTVLSQLIRLETASPMRMAPTLGLGHPQRDSTYVLAWSPGAVEVVADPVIPAEPRAEVAPLVERRTACRAGRAAGRVGRTGLVVEVVGPSMCSVPRNGASSAFTSGVANAKSSALTAVPAATAASWPGGKQWTLLFAGKHPPD